jgi:hypothetical protein
MIKRTVGGSTDLEPTYVSSHSTPAAPPSPFVWLQCAKVVLMVRLLNEGIIVVYFNVKHISKIKKEKKIRKNLH